MSLVDLDITNGIARLTLTRPDKRNALNADLMDAIVSALHTAEAQARVVTLSGKGPAFCAGADLTAVARMSTEAEYRAHADRMGGLFATLADLAIPSISIVTGPALGAGCGLVCAGTFAIAGPEARFGFPELGKGVLPALVIPPLVMAVGERRALHMLCTDTPLGATEALDLGLVTQVSDTPEAEAERLASHLAALAPDRLNRVRQLIRAAATASASEARHLATEANVADRRARHATPE